MILMDTCTEDELLDPKMHSYELLTRLFHEEGVRVYPPLSVSKGCRCSVEKVESVMSMMSEDDIEYMTVDGRIEVKCEFCSRDFIFDPARVKLMASKAQADTGPE
jgi:molecular chaperone Hsp33